MTRQINRFSAWAKSGSAGVGGQEAWSAPVEPGDIVSVVNGGSQGPLSGHVATVIKEEGDKIFYVSGNAAGVQAFEGAVRIEEVSREQPPGDYDWLKVGGRGNEYNGLKQQANAENKKADASSDEAEKKIAFIFANLPEDLAVVTDLNQLLALLIGRPDVLGQQALIGNLSEVLLAQGNAQTRLLRCLTDQPVVRPCQSHTV